MSGGPQLWSELALTVGWMLLPTVVWCGVAGAGAVALRRSKLAGWCLLAAAFVMGANLFMGTVLSLAVRVVMELGSVDLASLIPVFGGRMLMGVAASALAHVLLLVAAFGGRSDSSEADGD